MAASHEATRLILMPQEHTMAPNQQKPGEDSKKTQDQKQGQHGQKDQRPGESSQKR